MFNSSKASFKQLLESKDGVHLTIYMTNNYDLADFKFQLKQSLQEAQQCLNSILPADEIKKFFEPLDKLLIDASIIKQMKGHIGIFRNQKTFRVLNIPVDIEPSCQVATSFHIKPLLRWLQSDQNFFLLVLTESSADLYQGSQHTFKSIDSLFFETLKTGPSIRKRAKLINRSHLIKTRINETATWLNSLMHQLNSNTQPHLFFAGDADLIDKVQDQLKYPRFIRTPVLNTIQNESSAHDACRIIRDILQADHQKMFERALLEFRIAEEDKRASKNIFQISKAVVRGRVRKLIVTDELNIFGKIDLKSGGISIHPFDLDHEDDCLLDDLAQIVLSQGGEVLVAKRDEIPKGRPILAILHDDDSLTETKDDLLEEKPQEGVI